MSWLVTIAGWLQIAAAAFILISARSAMHETTAAAAFGAGVLALGLGRLLQYREDDDKRREAAEREARNNARKIV
ncbi:MAG: hypothetical protein MUE52_01785 [Tabrizicola sp.]|nr:hypothetical protein [Tabrizicola sp.]